MSVQRRLERLEATLPDAAALNELADHILEIDASLDRAEVLRSLRDGRAVVAGERLIQRAGAGLFIREYQDLDTADV